MSLEYKDFKSIHLIVDDIDAASPKDIKEAIATCHDFGTDQSNRPSMRLLYRGFAALLRKHLKDND